MSSRNRARARKRNESRRKKNLDRALALISEAEEKDDKPKIERARYTPMLDQYHSRGQIDERQHEAGTRFHQDWVRMGSRLSSGRVSAGSLEESIGVSYDDPTPIQLDCKRRVDEAIRAIGKYLSSVVINVCLFDYSAAEWAQKFGRPMDDGIACLRLGLDALADHYDKSKRHAHPMWQMPSASCLV